MWAPNSIEWVVSALAATYAGGVLVPVNSRYTASEAADIVERTRATLVVVDDGFLGRTQIADLRAASTLATVREVIDVNDLERLAALPSDVDIDSRARPSHPTTSPTSSSPAARPVGARARRAPTARRSAWPTSGAGSAG